jgi:lysophospholipase L1-like esterase
LKGAGRHVLTVYVKQSEQHDRWGTPGTSGSNVVRLTGLKVDADSKPATDAAQPRWALIVGDSITEGCGAYELEGYSHLVGQAFRALGYEYGISACGWSGWLHRGDNPPGDVPGYYTITGSVDGAGGQYSDADSRWNKIDASHSLLDARGHLSAYGQPGQEPSVIMINYGTNDAIHKTNASDVQASMSQGLKALRAAAPEAHIFILIPFGQYKAAELKQTVSAYQAAHPNDRRVWLIDLGPDAARALSANGYWGGLHPNPRAHATFAAEIIARMTATLGNSTLTSP